MAIETDAGDPRPRAAAAFWMVVVVLLLGTELFFHLRLPDWPYYRGWNATHQDSGPYAPCGAPGPFFPDVRYEGACYGDLAFLTDLPAFRSPRPQVFTTDGYGYRNTPGSELGPWTVVAFGDSVMAGSGISDGQTLPARLAERLGTVVYNAGGADASIALAERRWIETPPRVVIVESVERFLLADDATERLASLVPGSGPAAAPASGPPERRARGRWSRAYSAATHFGSLAYADLSYRLFGELTTRACIVGTDERTLFSIEELTHAAAPPALVGAERIADAVAFARDALRAHGIELVFLISPDKATLHRDLLPTDLARSLRPAGEHVRALQSLLAERGVPYADLLEPFQAALAADPGAALFWPDDTHWTPRGAALAAAVVAERIEPLLAAR